MNIPDTYYHVYTDGASKGNPGHAGLGVVIFNGEGEEVRRSKYYIGIATNNVAEYKAFICGLRETLLLGARYVRMYSDSEFLVFQMNGIYKVRSENLKLLNKIAHKFLAKFEKYEIHHIPREQNQLADMLAGDAVKKRNTEGDRMVADIFTISEESPSSVGQGAG